MFNEQNEIRGDLREEIRAELQAEAQAREEAAVEAHYQDWKAREQEIEDDKDEKNFTGLPPGWENAPLSAQVAFLVSDGDPELFDQIKAHLKGEL